MIFCIDRQIFLLLVFLLLAKRYSAFFIKIETSFLRFGRCLEIIAQTFSSEILSYA